MDAKDKVRYLYSNAIIMTQKALGLAKTSSTRKDLLKGAIAILMNLIQDNTLRELEIDWDARLLLCEILIRHTKSGILARDIIGLAVVSPGLKIGYLLKFKLLEMEYLINCGQTKDAINVYDDCEELLERVDTPELRHAFLLLRMQIGPVPDSAFETLLTSDSVFMQVLGTILRPNDTDSSALGLAAKGPENLRVLALLDHVETILGKGIKAPDAVIVRDLQEIDWEQSVWETGSVVIKHGNVNLEVQWHDKPEILHLCYLILVVFQFSSDDSSCETTSSWLTEMVQNIYETPPSPHLSGVIFFYTAMISHACNKASMRDMAVKELRQRSQSGDSQSSFLLEYCQGVIAQSEGRLGEAKLHYSRVQTQKLIPGFDIACIVNLFCINPKDRQIRSQLEEASRGLDKDAPLLNVCRLIHVLALKDELSMEAYQELVDELFKHRSESFLHDALIKSLRPALHTADYDSKITGVTDAICDFKDLGLNDWAAHNERVLTHIHAPE